MINGTRHPSATHQSPIVKNRFVFAHVVPTSKAKRVHMMCVMARNRIQISEAALNSHQSQLRSNISVHKFFIVIVFVVRLCCNLAELR